MDLEFQKIMGDKGWCIMIVDKDQQNLPIVILDDWDIKQLIKKHKEKQ